MSESESVELTTERQPGSLDRERLELDRERLKLDLERLALEKKRSSFEQRFFNKYLATIITAIISLAAVVVSGAQLWIARIAKTQEIVQQQQVLQQQIEQSNRDWSLKITAFVVDHSNEIFSENEQLRKRVRGTIKTVFPPAISSDLFDKIYLAADPSVKLEWQQAVSGFRWIRQSGEGKAFTESFVVISENRHNRPDIIASGTVSISNPQARIYKVEYRCEGYPCPWSFNPDPTKDGGIDYAILADGRSFTWRRRWDGDPCKETYTAFYEVPQSSK